MPTSLNVGKPSVTRGDWNTYYYGVTAGQTFVKGDWVYLVAAGTISIAAAAGNDVGNIKILGRAEANAADVLAQPTGRQLCPVAVPSDSGEFLVQLYHSTAASAVLAETGMDAPTVLPLRNQDGFWVANVENDGTNDRVVIVERHPKYAFSEQYGWFWARISADDLLWESAT